MRSRSIVAVSLAGAVCGCSSLSASVVPATYETASCSDLNVQINQVAQQITATAISRGNVGTYRIPLWLPGGQKGKQALIDRDTAKIERLRQQEDAMIEVRDRRCQ